MVEAEPFEVYLVGASAPTRSKDHTHPSGVVSRPHQIVDATHYFGPRLSGGLKRAFMTRRRHEFGFTERLGCQK